MSYAPMVLWLIVCLVHLVTLVIANDFQIIPLASPLYVFDGSWAYGNEGGVLVNASTWGGSVLFSFKGPLLTIPTTIDTSASVVWWIDGTWWGSLTHAGASIQQITLDDEDHQVMLQVQSATGKPWVFPGFALPTQNVTSQYYIPSTLGMNATAVPQQATVIENHDACIKYSGGWQVNDWTSTYWMNHDGDVGTSTSWNVAVTVYFYGTDIWIFGPVSSFRDRVLLTVTVDNDVVSTEELSYPKRDIPRYQALIWQSANLSDSLHAVTFTIHLNDNHDFFSLDFVKIAGNTAMNCTSFNAATPQGDDETALSSSQAMWAIQTGSLTALFFFAILVILCVKNRRKRRSRILFLASLSPAKKSDVLGSELSHDGIQQLPYSSSREDLPIVVTCAAPTLTPFDVAPDHPTQQQRRKEMPISPRFMPSVIIDIENTATLDTETESPIEHNLLLPPANAYRPETRVGQIGLPYWTPPPPSYLTELNPLRRPFQLLSEEDLGRLVDRVANLRTRNQVERRSNVHDLKDRVLLDPPSPQDDESIHGERGLELEAAENQSSGVIGVVQESEVAITIEDHPLVEDDSAVEVLARRIIQADRSGSPIDLAE